MSVTPAVKAIIDRYEGVTAGVKANLARILMQGRLGGTGKLIILPVDQGFEHGPGRSFAVNPAAYDPHYHYQLAIDAGIDDALRLGCSAIGFTIYPGSEEALDMIEEITELSAEAKSVGIATV